MDALRDYLEITYAVTYQSPQSYYTFLHDAGISYKKAQITNPKQRDDAIVQKKEITVFLYTHREAIANETIIVLFVDESHLNWFDTCGYGWCPTK